MSARAHARLAPRTAVVLAVASLAGLCMYCWPLLVQPAPGQTSPSIGSPFVFAAILPVVLAVVMAELHGGTMDSKSLAMLGVLSAIGAALRPLGAGLGGIEPMFFLLALAGRVFGGGFGFALGNTSMFASAILTAGIGPWLPFQMLAAGWVGLGAGLLGRRVRGRAEIAVLALYGAFAGLAFGFLINMWYWPYAIGTDTDLSFVAGAPILDNLRRYVLYTVATSTLGWDLGRAITNVVLIVGLGPTILATLRRASRRGSFGAVASFSSEEPAADRSTPADEPAGT